MRQRLTARGLPAVVAAVVWGAALSGTASALEPDLRLPGAEARLGLGGGFWAGAWSELRLEARGAGEYRLTLSAQDGSLRAGLTPFEARLLVPDAPGVRVARLRVPLFSRRPVTLRLEGPAGARSVKLEALQGTPAVRLASRVGERGTFRGERVADHAPESVAPDPALWLSGPDLLLEGAASRETTPLALAWLAAGGRVYDLGAFSGLDAVPDGPMGLGSLRRAPDDDPRVPAPGLERLVAALLPEPRVATFRHAALGFWAAGIFLVCLAFYSARRSSRAVAVGSAGAALFAGLLGAFALSPRDTVTEERTRVRIGAGGWGITTELVSRSSLRPEDLLLPESVQVVDHPTRTYETGATRVTQRAWSRLAYWTPPRAASLPVRAVNGRIENRSASRLERVFVVGLGEQEPVAPGSSALVRDVTDYPPTEYAGLVPLLPRGAVIARAVEGSARAVLIALPEGSK